MHSPELLWVPASLDTVLVSVKWHGCPKSWFGLEQHRGSGWHSRPLGHCGCIDGSHGRHWIHGPSGRYSGPLLHHDHIGGNYRRHCSCGPMVGALALSGSVVMVVCALDLHHTEFSVTGAAEISGTVVVVMPAPDLSSTLVPVVCALGLSCTLVTLFLLRTSEAPWLRCWVLWISVTHGPSGGCSRPQWPMAPVLGTKEGSGTMDSVVRIPHPNCTIVMVGGTTEGSGTMVSMLGAQKPMCLVFPASTYSFLW